jgi:hypothetical protein
MTTKTEVPVKQRRSKRPFKPRLKKRKTKAVELLNGF